MRPSNLGGPLLRGHFRLEKRRRLLPGRLVLVGVEEHEPLLRGLLGGLYGLLVGLGRKGTGSDEKKSEKSADEER